MILIALAIAVLDGLITFLNIKEREQWIAGDVVKAVVLDGLTTMAIGVSICVFVEFTWIMLVPSTLGSMIGRYLAWKY
jgi:hypothetical protein